MANKPVLSQSVERLQTPDGPIEYTLSRKRVRNLNLRVKPGGQVTVSAPKRMSKGEIEAFIAQKSKWITKNIDILRSQPAPAPCPYTPAECLALFTEISDAIFPLFADLLSGQKPILKVREMKSRWGSCHVKKRTITLNTRLAQQPRAAQEYVVLHEYVHFLHPNHQSGFHAEMARLMPDYRARRKLLRQASAF